MNSHRMFYLFLVLFIGSFSWLKESTPVSAQNGGSVYWQSNGGGCVPTDRTIQEKQYWTVTGGGRVKYKGNGIRPLVFTCPINNINYNVLGGDATVLRLFYQDPDGPGDNFKVVAKLKAFNKSTGSYSSEICGVTSDQAAQWEDAFTICNNIGSLDRNFLWVEITITRAQSSNLVVSFNGVSLEGAVL